MAKYQQRVFTIGKFYLGRRDNSPAYYRCWVEGSRTRRASLGTTDFAEAQEKLIEWFYENRTLDDDNVAPARMPLADVLLDYWNNHGKNLRSHETAQAHLRYWNEFWGEATVADVRSVKRQEEFQAALFARGMKPNSVNRVLECGRAAMRRAWKRGAISSAPFVHTVKVAESSSRGKALTVDELRAFYLGSKEQHWRDMVFLLTATAARPEAIMQLTKAQIDFAAGLIHLNPEGRPQTNKRRPTVKLTDGARERFAERPEGNIILFHGKPIGRPENGVRIVRRRAGLPETVTLYSIRHTCARWLRSEGVDTSEIANQLGHAKFGYDMTARYAPHAPEYLSKASAALDKLCRAAFL